MLGLSLTFCCWLCGMSAIRCISCSNSGSARTVAAVAHCNETATVSHSPRRFSSALSLTRITWNTEKRSTVHRIFTMSDKPGMWNWLHFLLMWILKGGNNLRAPYWKFDHAESMLSEQWIRRKFIHLRHAKNFTLVNNISLQFPYISCRLVFSIQVLKWITLQSCMHLVRNFRQHVWDWSCLRFNYVTRTWSLFMCGTWHSCLCRKMVNFIAHDNATSEWCCSCFCKWMVDLWSEYHS